MLMEALRPVYEIEGLMRLKCEVHEGVKVFELLRDITAPIFRDAERRVRGSRTEGSVDLGDTVEKDCRDFLAEILSKKLRIAELVSPSNGAGNELETPGPP
jgi:hypothetical protein